MPMERITTQQDAIIAANEAIEDATNPQVEETPDGGAIVTFGEEGNPGVGEDPAANEFGANLAEFMTEDALNELSDDLLALVKQDIDSRSDWENLFVDGLEMLGLKYEDRTEPFEGACAAVHPVLMESIVKFQAKAFGELLPPRGPVRTKIVGLKTPEKEAQARRVQEFMNYQLLCEMTEYTPTMDKLLLYVGFAGSAFKKTWFDPGLGRITTRLVTAEDFIVNYRATDLRTAERYTHQFDMSGTELKREIASGFYREVKLDIHNEVDTTTEEVKAIEGSTFTVTDDENYRLYEIHTNWEIPEGGEGVLPYIITIDKNSGAVLSVRRNWREGDPNFIKRQYFTHFMMIPGLGFYGYGYFHLIGGLTRTATGSMRQLIDAGTFATLPAGFKAHGLRVTGDDSPLLPGEWREVNAAGMDISKALVPLPYKEPSPTLFNLLSFVVEAAQRFADATEQVISDSTNYGPVGTTMALLEASGKMFSAIHKRLHYAQSQDLKLQAEINAETLPEVYPYEVEGGASEVLKTDFDGRIDVLPVSDPDMPSKAHRLAKAQALVTQALQVPQEHDLKEVMMESLSALDYENPTRFLRKNPPTPEPMDPISENMAALQGIPIKSAEWQEHDAHLKLHVNFVKNPLYMQNEQAMMSMMAHINEHLAHKMRVEMQKALGVALPPAGQPVPPEIQNQIAIAVAQMADKLLEKGNLDAQILGLGDMLAQGQGEDPQIKREEMALKRQEMQLKMRMEKQKLDLQREDMLRSDENADLDRELELYKVSAQQDQVKMEARIQQNSDIMNHQMSMTQMSAQHHNTMEEASLQGTLGLAQDKMNNQAQAGMQKEKYNADQQKRTAATDNTKGAKETPK